MPNAPSPPTSNLSFKPPKWAVLLSSDGDQPALKDEVNYLIPQVIRFGAGAERLPEAILYNDLFKQDARIVDAKIAANYSCRLAIQTKLDSGDYLPVFDGEIGDLEIELGKTERALTTASLQPFHFGKTLDGPRVVNASGSPVNPIEITDPRVVSLHTAIVFNPEIDGDICGNLNPYSQVPTHQTGGGSYFLWVNPESVRTDEARDIAGIPANLGFTWDLSACVQTICWLCNPDQTFVENPSPGLPGTSPDVKNVHLPRGKYLPELLDLLLKPHGYYWTLVPKVYDPYDNDPDAKPSTARYTIKIFKLGEGIQRDVLLQRPGNQLSRSATNVRSSKVATSIFDMANVVVGHGALREFEGTFELVRGWPESEDNLTADKLDRVDGENKTNQRAWRLFIYNEAGDFNGVRASITAPGDLSDVLPTTVPARRRRIYPCLTYAQDTPDKHNRRHRPVVSYLDPGDSTWKEIPDTWGTPRILEHMMGIYFDGQKPPDELIAMGANARIRITGVIVDDLRVTATATRQDTSPNARDVKLFLDLSDRFFYRQIVASGTHASEFAGSGLDSDARDDTSALQTFINEIQSVEDAALIRADITLAGINTAIKVGDLIRSVNGRNISLNRKSSTAATKEYPQVFGITYDYPNQATVLEIRAVAEAELKAELKLAGFREERDKIPQKK